MHVNKNNQDSRRASGLQNHTLMWAGHMPPCLLELWAWPEQGGPSQALVAFPGLPSPCSGGQKAVPGLDSQGRLGRALVQSCAGALWCAAAGLGRQCTVLRRQWPVGLWR